MNPSRIPCDAVMRNGSITPYATWCRMYARQTAKLARPVFNVQSIYEV